VAGPPEQEKVPCGALTPQGDKTGGRDPNSPTASESGQTVKPWVWGWPRWVGHAWLAGKGVRRAF